MGGLSAEGYGIFHVEVGRSPMTAHRFAYEDKVGPIPEGMLVLHSCDEQNKKLCCNPAHLFIGTHEDVKYHHGHYYGMNKAKGEKQGNAKLTEHAVREIRARRENGETLAEIASDHRVSIPTIWNVCERKTWAHVE